MLARHLGQPVGGHPEGRVEVGYYPIRPTDAGHGLCAAPFPTCVYQWHREGFDLPNGATLLAEGEDFEAQAIRVGERAFGLQFHPDVTYAMMCQWTVTALERMNQPGAQERAPPSRRLVPARQRRGALDRIIFALLERRRRLRPCCRRRGGVTGTFRGRAARRGDQFAMSSVQKTL